MPATTASAEAEAEPAPRLNGAAYCGLYCVYAAGLREGSRISFASMLQQKYVGSSEGSSVQELEHAAADAGLHAMPFVNGTLQLLREQQHPVILHVKTTVGASRYTHYVLFLGERSGMMDVIDPGYPLKAMAPEDVAALWDGVGLIVSSQPLPKTALLLSTWKSFLAAFLAAILVIAVAKRLASRAPALEPGNAGARLLPAFAQAGLIIAVAAGTAVGFNYLNPGGLLGPGSKVAEVQQAHAADFIPKIQLSDAKKLHESNKAVWIDARYFDDFARGHIDGAMNVPVDMEADARRNAMAAIPKDAPIVLYCMSKKCPYSKRVAASLRDDGYTNLSLMVGGWREWVAAK